MRRFIKRALKLALLLLFITAGVAGVVVQASGSKLLSVQSGSMEPRLNRGELVVVTSVPVGSLAIGDVITFISSTEPGKTITHRIADISKENGYFVTKGDANEIEDQYLVSPTQVVGKVTHSVPFVGHVIDFIRQPLGLLLVIYVPAIWMIVVEVKLLTRHYKRIKPYLMPTSEPRWQSKANLSQKLWGTTKISAFLIVVTSAFMIPVWAALTTSAKLTNNSISTVATTPPNCHGNNNNNVVINNTTNQTAASGNASNSNNTNGGSATSGNASNTNNTNINVTITNC